MIKIIYKLRYLISTLLFYFISAISKKITIKSGLKVKLFPCLILNKNSRLIIGKNVTLNSSNYYYHANMYKKIKIQFDNSFAIIQIGDNTRIHGSLIHVSKKISIGKNCLIAGNCQIFDSNGHDICEGHPQDRIKTIGKAKPIEIKDNVWIGINSIILPGVTIGEGSVIAAGSIVNKNIPDNVIAGGNPIRIIKKINQGE